MTYTTGYVISPMEYPVVDRAKCQVVIGRDYMNYPQVLQLDMQGLHELSSTSKSHTYDISMYLNHVYI